MPAPAHLAPPPRPVPLLLQGAIFCGGLVSQLGWLFLGIGLLLGTIFAPFARTASYLLYFLETKSVQGTIIESRYSRMTQGGTRQRAGRRVHVISFSFVAEGKTYNGVSYDLSPHQQGETVTVEYPAGFPSVARIEGTNLTAAGPFTAFVYLFALIGLLMVLRGIRRGLPALSLLANGALSLGTLKKRERTGLAINHRMVYRLFYSFPALDGQKYQAVTSDEYTTKFGDLDEPVLYDPQNPASTLVLKGLPCAVKFDESGNPAAGMLSTVPSLVVPAAVILGKALVLILAPPGL